MKVRWIICAILLFALASAIYPWWRMRHPSTPAYFEPAHENQATPEDTVKAMFEIMLPRADKGDVKKLIEDKLDNAHLLLGKNMTLEEQQFAQFFWEHHCSAVVYNGPRLGLSKSPRVTGHHESGDTATVDFSISVVPENGSYYVDMNGTFDLKKRGSNWHISDMRTTSVPNGACKAYMQSLGAE